MERAGLDRRVLVPWCDGADRHLEPVTFRMSSWPPPGWSTGDQVLSALSADSLASYVAGIAGSLVGLGTNPDDPVVRRNYLDLIGPFNSEEDRADMATRSGCGLTILGLYRCLGLSKKIAREAWKAYVPSQAFTDMLAIAGRCKVWLPHDTDPMRADAVVVGINISPNETPEKRARLKAKWGSPAHVMLVTDVLDGQVLSVDGGQKDPEGHQLVTVKRRPLTRRGSQVWIGDRRVYAVVRLRDIGPHLTEPSCWPTL